MNSRSVEREHAGSLFLAALQWNGLGEWLAERLPGQSPAAPAPETVREEGRRALRSDRSESAKALATAGPVVVITVASEGLPDADAIIDSCLAGLPGYPDRSPWPLRFLDSTHSAPALADAVAVVMPGGDPFRLLRWLRGSGAGAVLTRRHAAGMPVAGQSAGAMVCSPDLAPVTLTSPFRPDSGQSLTGLGLVRQLVLPHQDRPGRAALHRRALQEFGQTSNLMPLWDDEVLQVATDRWQIRAGTRFTRPARQEDAAAIESVYRAAAAAAWSPFLGHERLLAAPWNEERWASRIGAPRTGFLVTGVADAIDGFVCWRDEAERSGGAELCGEVDLLYTSPEVWGQGIGRRLLDRATLALLAAGRDTAVLWTEARNTRALAIYAAGGWRPDGAVDARDYLGVPIRNLRLRLDLDRLAGNSQLSRVVPTTG